MWWSLAAAPVQDDQGSGSVYVFTAILVILGLARVAYRVDVRRRRRLTSEARLAERGQSDVDG